MKKLLSMLLFLSCTSHGFDTFIVEQDGAKNKIAQYSCHEGPNTDDCCNINECYAIQGPKGKRGPRGKRGKRGHRGHSAQINLFEELFINADMMINGEYSSVPDKIFNDSYDFLTPLDAWKLQPYIELALPIGAQFVIPDTLDRTQPVTLTIHCLNQIGEEYSGDIQIQVLTDYRATGEALGVNPPGNGYTETLLTAVHTIVPEPTSTSLRYFTLSVPLDPTLMVNKTWGFITLVRTFFGSENRVDIYVTAMSIKYTKISS